MSFYAFRDDNLYQANPNNQEPQHDPNKIAGNASVIVETLLSSTVHDIDGDSLNDLEDNVTISFEISEVSF